MALARLMRRMQDAFSSPQEMAPADRERHLRLATAALLLEIAHADENLSDAEETRLFQHVREQFDLDDESARELVDAADDFREESIDYYGITRILREQASLDDRISLLRAMWRIVYADGRLRDEESHLIRKLSDLLGIEHHIMIEAKLNVRRELGYEEV